MERTKGLYKRREGKRRQRFQRDQKERGEARNVGGTAGLVLLYRPAGRSHPDRARANAHSGRETRRRGKRGCRFSAVLPRTGPGTGGSGRPSAPDEISRRWGRQPTAAPSRHDTARMRAGASWHGRPPAQPIAQPCDWSCPGRPAAPPPLLATGPTAGDATWSEAWVERGLASLAHPAAQARARHGAWH